LSLKKISEMTGISMSTVSRILRDPNHKCSSENVREKVLQAARKINYVPNDAARRLKTGGVEDPEIRYINILLTRMADEDNDPLFNEMLRLIEIEIRNNSCIVSSVWHRAEFSDDKFSMSENVENIVRGMYDNKEQHSDGLIIIGNCSAKVLKALKKREKNIVSINRNSTNYEVDEVLCDGRKIALSAISHLVKCGHRKIGYVGSCHNESRFEGYQSAQIKFQLETDIDYIYDTAPNEANGYSAMEYFMRLSDPPTGIYCANDIIAIGMLKCLNKRKARYYVPSIISSDDIEEAQYTSPMLTTVSLPKSDMVRLGLILLLERINGGHKTVSKLELEGTLVVRESCRSIAETQEPEYYI